MKNLFRLESHDVHVWSLRLDISRAVVDRLEAVLSAAELSRARRFIASAERRRFVAARGLLRVVLSGYMEVRPEEVALETGAGGKPCVEDRKGPRFNLSHAGNRGLIAVSADREVGIDLEEVRELADLEGLVRTCFSPVERAAFAKVPTRHRRRAFFAGWTRKEAFLKALGEGLSRPLDSFDVTLEPGEPARLLRVRGAPGAPARYELRDLRPALGHVGALAIDGQGATIRLRPWPLLSALLEQTPTAPSNVEAAGSSMDGKRKQ